MKCAFFKLAKVAMFALVVSVASGFSLQAHAANSVAGAVTNISGASGQIYVGLATDSGMVNVVASSPLDIYGNYTINVDYYSNPIADGTYYVGGFVDVYADQFFDDQTEPFGMYSSPVVLAGSPVAAVDFTIDNDSDKDGVPDYADAFVNDPAASVDSDGDGYADNWNWDATGQQIYDSSLLIDAAPYDYYTQTGAALAIDSYATLLGVNDKRAYHSEPLAGSQSAWWSEEWYERSAGSDVSPYGVSVQGIRSARGTTDYISLDANGLTEHASIEEGDLINNDNDPAMLTINHDFVLPPSTAPTSSTEFDSIDFSVGNLQAPSAIFPQNVTVGQVYKRMYAQTIEDLNGNDQHKEHLVVEVAKIDDNNGNGHDLTDPAHPDYDAELVALWAGQAGNPLSGLIRYDFRSTSYSRGGVHETAVSGYMKPGIGDVALVYSEIATDHYGNIISEQEGRDAITTYSIGGSSGIMSVLAPVQVQVQDVYGSPATGSYLRGQVYDSYGNLMATHYALEDTPDSGLFTVVTFGPDNFTLSYGADAYLTWFSTMQDIYTLAQSSTPTYVLTHPAAMVDINVQDIYGNPISDAGIFLTNYYNPNAGYGITDIYGNFTAKVDDYGIYTVGVDTWDPYASRYQYLGLWTGDVAGLNVDPYSTYAFSPINGQSVTLTLDMIVGPPPSGSVSGVVTNSSGATGNILVGLFYDPYAMNDTGLGGAIADPYGNYSLAGIPDGTYYVFGYVDVNGNMAVTGPDVNEPFGGGTQVVVSGGGAATGADFTIGAVVDSDGDGVGDYWDHYPTNPNYALEADSDGDGMADSWEIANFGNLTTAGVGTDFNNNGVSDLQEFNAGTDPTAALGLASARADYDASGMSDVLMRNGANSQWKLYQMNGSTVTAQNFVSLPNASWIYQGSGDFNGDGVADVLVRNSTGSLWRIYRLNGSAIVSNQLAALTADPAYVMKGIGDFNNDGMSDVLLRNTSTNQWLMYLMSGNQILQQLVPGLPTNAVWVSEGLGDFNGDGMSDVLMRNTTGNFYRLYEMSSGTVLNNAVTSLAPAPWTVQSIGDYNGDGKADIFFRHGTGNYWRLYEMNGGAVLNNAIAQLPPFATWTIQTTGDFNGDGIEDVLMRDSVKGLWRIYSMNGPTVLSNNIVLLPTSIDWAVMPAK